MRRTIFAAGLSTAASFCGTLNAKAQNAYDLRSMSIEELASINVTSVTKETQSVSAAPAAIYVITREAINRSGAHTVPELLRLAPNLFVAEISPNRYVITARGLSGSDGAQNFTNKLLVLIDGRSVYTPIFSGVLWDQQDVDIADIDRIEVISGPGSTLWGANAVNGVINIITRNAADSQTSGVRAFAGTQERGIGARVAGKIGPSLAWRAYVKTYDATETRLIDNKRGGNGLARTQGGFRFDYAPGGGDAVTLQGDAYGGAADMGAAPGETISGGNLTARWTHRSAAGSELQVQAYYDRAHRGVSPTGLPYTVNTYDASAQQSFVLGAANALVAGAGVRVVDYAFGSKPNFFFVPARSTRMLGDAFVQDSITVSRPLKLILGLKVEADPYIQPEVLPSVRLAWTPGEQTLVWGAVSRAIRAPTPFDRDVVELVPGALRLTGDPGFRSETLFAYEVGTRFRFGERASVSASVFYNDYDRLRNIELLPGPGINLRWGNGLRAATYGVTVWGDVVVAPWWRLSPSFSWLEVDASFRPGAGTLAGVSQLGDDPEYRAGLKSSVTAGRHLLLDSDLRFVDRLPNPRVPGYVELNTRAAWRFSERLELSVVGANLLHDHHLEFPAPATAIPRSVTAEIRWRF